MQFRSLSCENCSVTFFYRRWFVTSSEDLVRLWYFWYQKKISKFQWEITHKVKIVEAQIIDNEPSYFDQLNILSKIRFKIQFLSLCVCSSICTILLCFHSIIYYICYNKITQQAGLFWTSPSQIIVPKIGVFLIANCFALKFQCNLTQFI